MQCGSFGFCTALSFFKKHGIYVILIYIRPGDNVWMTRRLSARYTTLCTTKYKKAAWLRLFRCLWIKGIVLCRLWALAEWADRLSGACVQSKPSQTLVYNEVNTCLCPQKQLKRIMDFLQTVGPQREKTIGEAALLKVRWWEYWAQLCYAFHFAGARGENKKGRRWYEYSINKQPVFTD